MIFSPPLVIELRLKNASPVTRHFGVLFSKAAHNSGVFPESFIDDTSSQGIFSQPSEAPKVLPLEIELEDLSILEVDERAAILEINFKVANPNYKSVLLQLITYEIYENDVKIVSGQIGERAGGMMVVGSNYFLILNEQPSFFT